MDAVMPRRNGFDATREVVRNSPEIPVVITTLVSLKDGLA
jgi:DNA-binding NarL/FixJ family response regulator